MTVIWEFQPFLRFYVDNRVALFLGKKLDRVSTHLEILQALRGRDTRQPQVRSVSTLLEILPAAGGEGEEVVEMFSFQPFLRFYAPSPVQGASDRHTPVSTLLEILILPDMHGLTNRLHPGGHVSTLLEILPLMLGGFLGF